MKPTVLVVDDSMTVRMDLAEAFDAGGFVALLCATLADARAALARGGVDAVVLDVLLPDGDGTELLSEVRGHQRDTPLPVLMLSMEADVHDRTRGLKLGADEYVGKPYDAGYVVARTRELLRTRPAATDTANSVLLIDDSRTFREELAAALRDSGYKVSTAGSGEEGLRMAADQLPAAVVVDGILPGIDGATVIRRLRLDAALRSIPCLMLTGSDDGRAELRALDAGVDAFVRKDADFDVILARLSALLRHSDVPRAVNATASLLGPKRILAVDDSETYLNTLADTLRAEGYDVILARSGQEALDLLAVQPVDCILLDLLMPGLSGEETCRRIKSVPLVRDIPLIMLTALDDREAMIGGLGAGADDYIAKSGEVEVLRARVRAQIRRKQSQDENRRIREELLCKEMEATEARAARQLAETRAALVEELERRNEDLEAFSYSVSHDLRAPLRSIDGFSLALLEDCHAQLDEKGKDYLRRVRAAAQRMGELIDDLLELSRVGRTELRSTQIDLSGIAVEVLSELRRTQPDRSVVIEVQPSVMAQADCSLMRVVLENLFGNAWKFTSRTAQACIVFRGARRDDFLDCSVTDNGAGFDMSYSDKLFRPFQRLHSEAEFPGTGIGLATVRRIIERHGGRTWVEASVGRGASVHFTLPETRRRERT